MITLRNVMMAERPFRSSIRHLLAERPRLCSLIAQQGPLSPMHGRRTACTRPSILRRQQRPDRRSIVIVLQSNAEHAQVPERGTKDQQCCGQNEARPTNQSWPDEPPRHVVSLRSFVTAGERPRSAARDLRRTTPPDFIASLLHRLVRARDLLRRLDRLVRRFFRGLGRYLGTHGHDFGHQTHHGLLGQLH